RERIPRVYRAGEVGAEIVGPGRIERRVDADVARHLFEVEAVLHVVTPLDPGEVARDILDRVGAVEGPAAVETIPRDARDSLARGLCAEPRREAEIDIRPQVQNVGREDSRQRDRLAIGALER